MSLPTADSLVTELFRIQDQFRWNQTPQGQGPYNYATGRLAEIAAAQTNTAADQVAIDALTAAEAAAHDDLDEANRASQQATVDAARAEAMVNHP